MVSVLGLFFANLSDPNDPKFSVTHSKSNFSVPPKIVDSLSSSDMVQTEGSNVTLECVASGSPEPEVVWRREDSRQISIDKNTTGKHKTSANT